MIAVVSSFKPKKAPGAEGFTAEICRHIIFQDPQCFTLGHLVLYDVESYHCMGQPGELRSWKLCLPAYCTVYQPKLPAKQAVCRVSREILNCSAGSCGIYSDSNATEDITLY